MLITTFLLGSYASCTDLNEDVYSEITEDALSDENLVYMLAPIYGQYRWLLEWRSAWDMAEESTDAWVTPTNSDGGWYDGGIYQRLHLHTWNTYDPHFDDVWSHLYYGVSTCNRVMYQIQSKGELSDTEKKIISEIKVARAYYYYLLCSFYGNVPIVDRHDVPEDYLPATRPRKEVFYFVVNELKNNCDNLSEDPNFSRFNKWSAKHLLSKAYQNAEAWIGENKLDSCLIHCNDIINSRKYELDSKFSNVFSLNNQASREVILSFPNDEKNGVPVLFVCYTKTRHWLNGPSFNASAAGYNGLRAVPSFIDTFNENDGRLKDTYAMGQQYNMSTGEALYFTDNKTPFIYTKDIASFTNAGEFDGYRFAKYEIKAEQKNETDQDWVAFRFGETLMMKAECLLRQGDSQGAADIVNDVRARSFAENVPESIRKLKAQQLEADATVDKVSVKYGEFLNELGREFAGEMLRREQLVRWNLFTKGTWTFHESSNSDHLNIFPIPEAKRQVNANLNQNDKY
jgi:hypothetical protein